MNKNIVNELLISIKHTDSKKLIKEISNIDLSSSDLALIREYNKKIGERPSFLWKWAKLITCEKNPKFMLSSVSNEYFDSVGNLKIVLILLISLFDDVADKNKNIVLLDEMNKILFDNDNSNPIKIKNKKDKLIYDFTKKVWAHCLLKIKDYPRYDEFKDLFMYDLKQTINSMYYSCLVNYIPEIINLSEVTEYGADNMGFFLYADIDLMASPNFDKMDFSLLREVIFRAQKMARIGNWVSTWKREINEKDISSGIFAYAVSKNLISPNNLSLNNKKIINNISYVIENSDAESFFLEEWEKLYFEIKNMSNKIKSVDIDEYLSALKRIMYLHLLSKGHK